MTTVRERKRALDRVFEELVQTVRSTKARGQTLKNQLASVESELESLYQRIETLTGMPREGIQELCGLSEFSPDGKRAAEDAAASLAGKRLSRLLQESLAVMGNRSFSLREVYEHLERTCGGKLDQKTRKLIHWRFKEAAQDGRIHRVSRGVYRNPHVDSVASPAEPTLQRWRFRRLVLEAIEYYQQHNPQSYRDADTIRLRVEEMAPEVQRTYNHHAVNRKIYDLKKAGYVCEVRHRNQRVSWPEYELTSAGEDYLKELRQKARSATIPSKAAAVKEGNHDE